MLTGCGGSARPGSALHDDSQARGTTLCLCCIEHDVHALDDREWSMAMYANARQRPGAAGCHRACSHVSSPTLAWLTMAWIFSPCPPSWPPDLVLDTGGVEGVQRWRQILRLASGISSHSKGCRSRVQGLGFRCWGWVHRWLQQTAGSGLRPGHTNVVSRLCMQPDLALA